MNMLSVHRAGPALSVQDLGRKGYRAFGLSRAGALDLAAHRAGGALLGQSPDCASLEMIGYGGVFEVSAPTIFALTGASLRADLDGKAIETHLTYAIAPGQRLSVAGVSEGQIGYLHFAGGILSDQLLNSRSVNAAGGIGHYLRDGAQLALGAGAAEAGKMIEFAPPASREIAVLPSFQSDRFSAEILARFEETQFSFALSRFGRQGVELSFAGTGFAAKANAGLVSDAVAQGDIQIIGDGTPFVLLAESQTIGGYPRIASILPCEMAKLIQAPQGESFRFRFVSYEEAAARMAAWRKALEALPQRVKHKIRDPRQMTDLMSYNLIDGVVNAKEEAKDEAR